MASSRETAAVLARAQSLVVDRDAWVGEGVALWLWFENDLRDAARFDAAPPGGERGPMPERRDWHNTYWSTFKYWRHRSPYLSSRREHFHQGQVETILHYNPFEELDLSRPEIQRGLECTREALAAFQARAKSEGALPVVALMPFKESVYVEEFRSIARQERPFELLDSTRERVRGMIEELGLPVLDLTPFLRSVRDQPIYQVADAHLSPLGNRLAAGELAGFLQGLTDSPK